MDMKKLVIGVAICGLVALAALFGDASPALATTPPIASITSPDGASDVGPWLSMALDASSYPVVSYLDDTNDDLKVMHCNDINCAGGDESITTPHSAGEVGGNTSLELDSAGFPVISYYDSTNGDLYVMHCNDANCTGNNERITSPDVTGDVGTYTSLALDASGFPVVSYYDSSTTALKLIHCNDPYCAGGNESITAPHTAGSVGKYTSLALDSSGNPVVSYYYQTSDDLYVMHCNDANCAGSDESIVVQHTTGVVGTWTSLALDSSWFPVVSYRDVTNGYLYLLHCNDANCSGPAESVVLAADPDSGAYSSLALDASGRPVISYWEQSEADLRLLHCDDAGCASEVGNSTAVDQAGDVGHYTSLQLDGSGNPVIAYHDETNGDVKIARCGTYDCAIGAGTAPDTAGFVGQYNSLALDGAGNPIVSYRDSTNSDLKILDCGNANCTSGNAINAPDTVGFVGYFTSLALDGAGDPVVSYYDDTNSELKVLHCSDQACAGGTIASPDTAGQVGWYTSLELDGAGNPVVSYSDMTNYDLKVLHCGNPNCTSGNSTTSPDMTGQVG